MLGATPGQHRWGRQSVLLLLIIGLAWPGGARRPVTAAPAQPATPHLIYLPVMANGFASGPVGFNEEVVLNRLPFVVTFDWAPDGRMFLALRDGRVWIYENGVLLPDAFVDLSEEVNIFGDRGMLGMALDPNFAVTPYVYLLYSYDPLDLPASNVYDSPDGAGPRVSRMVRVTADPAHPNQALPDSQVVLLGTNSTLANIAAVDESGNGVWPYTPPSCMSAGLPIRDCVPGDFVTHSVGALRFGPDGSLYVSIGDASSFRAPNLRALRAQNLDILVGKILRLNPATGDGYPNNPYYDGDVRSNRSKVVNYGLRNPFRFTVHPSTGELLIGDVGGYSWEELDIGHGRNFGWPCYEGAGPAMAYANYYETQAACAAIYSLAAGSVTSPTLAYPHPGGAAIVVGTVYDCPVFPEEYQGKLFVGDYVRMWIKYVDLTEPTPVLHDFFDLDESIFLGPVEIRQGPDCNLYYAAFSRSDSQIRRIRYTAGGNTAPTARVSATPDNGGLPLEVLFSATASSDPDAEALTFAWGFGDGATGVGITATHTYTTQNTYTAVLTVTDALSATSSAQIIVTAGNHRPVAELLAPITGTLFTIGATLEFSGTAQDTEDGALTEDSLWWSLILHHNQHVHPNWLPPTTGTTGSHVATDHGDNTWFELCLTATDSEALSDTVCRQILPEAALYHFRTDPPGLELIFDGAARTTPFDVAVTLNAQRDVTAPDTQGAYGFNGWPDLLSNSLTITSTAPGQVITATYSLLPRLVWLPVIER